jgi:hypothetical protein
MQANTTGTCNIGIGICSHDNLDGGCNNVALGFSAGQNLSTGCYNVSIGDSVCLASPDGSCQLAIGFSPTANWLTGDSTKAIKPGAGIIDCANVCGTAGQFLRSNGSNAICWDSATATPTVTGVLYGCTTAAQPSTGAGEVALGLNAMGARTTGLSNTAIGGDALPRLTTGCSNTAIGQFAGYAITTACDNVLVGDVTSLNGTQPSNSVVIGSNADRDNNGRSNNVIIGGRAQYTTAGDPSINDSVIIGANALSGTAHVGSCMIGIGYNLVMPSTNGNCQLALGIGSSYWLTGNSTGAIKPGAGIIDCADVCGTAGQVLVSTGTNKICWGSPAAATPVAVGTVLGCTTATNTALGCNAAPGPLAISAISNTALGNCAGFALDDACCNTLVGKSAGCALNFGLGHTVIGAGAGAAITTAAFNVFVGTRAGASATNSRNVFIGAEAGCAQTTGSSNVAIGDGVNVPITTGGCQLAIGYSSAFTCWLTGNSTGAIKPGAGIIDCANSCGTAGQVLTSTGTNRLQWAAAPTNWTAAGTVQVVGLSATTTGPSIGTAGFNQVYYRSAGAKMWQVSLVLEKAAGGVDGSGDYLFTLPNGLQFDTTLQTQRLWTGNVGSSNNDLILLGLQGSTGAINQSPSLSTILQPVIWSATQYRLITNLSGQYRAWGSGMFNMGSQKYATTQFQFQST